MTYTRLQATDISLYKSLMQLFATVFKDSKSYQSNPPDDRYIQDFLHDQSHISLVAIDEQNTVIGGLVAYELQKFEQDRREIYIYDLAVLQSQQRQGIGTGLMQELRSIAQESEAYVIFVQADTVDDGAVSFYRKISTSEIETINFDILPA